MEQCPYDMNDNPLSFIIIGVTQFPESYIMPDHSLTWNIIGAREMPSKPTWFHRLPGILDVLRGMATARMRTVVK